MSGIARARAGRKEFIVMPSSGPPREVGRMGGRKVTKANTLPTWVIAVNALAFLILGIAGGIGLLHTHGLISLPSGLHAIVGSIGNTGLWAIAVAGEVGAAALTAYGVYRVKRGQRQKKFLKDPPGQKKPASLPNIREAATPRRREALPGLVAPKTPTSKGRASKLIKDNFKDNFSEIGIDKDRYNTLDKNTFISARVGASFIIILKNPSGKLLCTRKRLEWEVLDMKDGLRQEGYRQTQRFFE